MTLASLRRLLPRRLLAELELPASPGGTPMTYTVGDRQYIALATGSGKNAGLVALTLPVR